MAAMTSESVLDRLECGRVCFCRSRIDGLGEEEPGDPAVPVDENPRRTVHDVGHVGEGKVPSGRSERPGDVEPDAGPVTDVEHIVGFDQNHVGEFPGRVDARVAGRPPWSSVAAMWFRLL